MGAYSYFVAQRGDAIVDLTKLSNETLDFFAYKLSKVKKNPEDLTPKELSLKELIENNKDIQNKYFLGLQEFRSFGDEEDEDECDESDTLESLLSKHFEATELKSLLDDRIKLIPRRCYLSSLMLLLDSCKVYSYLGPEIRDALKDVNLHLQSMETKSFIQFKKNEIGFKENIFSNDGSGIYAIFYFQDQKFFAFHFQGPRGSPIVKATQTYLIDDKDYKAVKAKGKFRGKYLTRRLPPRILRFLDESSNGNGLLSLIGDQIIGDPWNCGMWRENESLDEPLPINLQALLNKFQ
ncbi:hypothetical protein O9G_004719 [Rozella allomycis CSF55]|uniref:Uncharacterized protein n=1 Tax=Rozella allomycis (strain CSF55) TaxID=988480 RepID=A0A075AW29_ROZAC|nr:hypothetical protein O9G_004719 [Rozella allomycis CSF55]|eukprot:EPZ34465.1 hypothetical protein O9G_004719 [Rozella allomycis CSF55]